MCGICRKDFAYKHVLKRHMKLHRQKGGTNDEVNVHVVEVEVDQMEEVEESGIFSIMSAASTLARQPSTLVGFGPYSTIGGGKSKVRKSVYSHSIPGSSRTFARPSAKQAATETTGGTSAMRAAHGVGGAGGLASVGFKQQSASASSPVTIQDPAAAMPPHTDLDQLSTSLWKYTRSPPSGGPLSTSFTFAGIDHTVALPPPFPPPFAVRPPPSAGPHP